MFGAYRTILALAVAAAHLGFLPTGAHYAVFGFFILSGYLMTFILHRTYGYTLAGRVNYLANRVLRIYPPYWVATILAAILVACVGRDAAVAYHPSIFLPTTAKGILENVLLAFSYNSEPRLVPPAWALSVELFFYLCMGLGLSRDKTRTLAWFFLSAGYTVVINLAGADFDFRYYLIPSASLPFSTGALIYHFRDTMLERFRILNSAISPLILFALLYLELKFAIKWNGYYTWGYYIAYFLNALLILSLLDKKRIAGMSSHIDAIVGDFSYPIYLMHYPSGLLLIATGLTSARRGQAVFFYAALPILVLLAWAATRCVERPIELIRQRIKGKRALERQAQFSIESTPR